MSSAEIAESMGVSDRWVRRLWSRYRFTRPEDIVWPPRMGRLVEGLPGHREHSAVMSCCNQGRRMVVRIETMVVRSIGIHISYHTIHGILKDEELAENQPAKAKQRKWVRYERRYSNSLWHTDYKQLPDGKWFVSFQDDASRLIVGFGVFDEATTDHAIRVLEDAIKRYGKPAQILTDRGSQFYANEKENTRRDTATFETRLVDLDIKHVLARVRHPQTNGKLKRFHLEMERYLKSFEDESAFNTSPECRARRPCRRSVPCRRNDGSGGMAGRLVQQTAAHVTYGRQGDSCGGIRVQAGAKRHNRRRDGGEFACQSLGGTTSRIAHTSMSSDSLITHVGI